MSFPYQNINTLNLPREKWKSIRGYEGYYMVSNKGRVKSLDRRIPHPRLKSQFIKGKILKQKVHVDFNSLDVEGMVSLQVALCRENAIRFRNVRRLVYDTFVSPIEFKKDGLYIINVDGNGLNNKVENLQLVSKKEKSRRAFNKGRVPESYLKTADRSQWKKIYGGPVNRKKVVQVNPIDGSTIEIFESITKASISIGGDMKEIINTAKGRRDTYKGSKWRYYQSEN